MSVGRTGCTLVVLGQSSHEVALRAALEPPHGHRKYIYFSPLVLYRPVLISDFSGVFYAEYLSFTMAISVSPRYPSHYLYPIHTCACDLCP